MKRLVLRTADHSAGLSRKFDVQLGLPLVFAASNGEDSIADELKCTVSVRQSLRLLPRP